MLAKLSLFASPICLNLLQPASFSTVISLPMTQASPEIDLERKIISGLRWESKLDLSCSVKHLGHIPYSNLSDTEDIERVKKDLTRKANCIPYSFSCCNPLVKTKRFSNFCLSLYESVLWSSSASALSHWRHLTTTYFTKFGLFPICVTLIFHIKLLSCIAFIYWDLLSLCRQLWNHSQSYYVMCLPPPLV